MKSIKSQLIQVAAVLVLGVQATAASAQAPAQTPANNTRHAQEAAGGKELTAQEVRKKTRLTMPTSKP